MSNAAQYIALGRDIRGGLGDIGNAKLQSAQLNYQLGRQQKQDERQAQMDAYAEPGLKLEQAQNQKAFDTLQRQNEQNNAPIKNMGEMLTATFGDGLDDQSLSFIALNNILPKVAKANGWAYDTMWNTYAKKTPDGKLAPLTRQDLYDNQVFTKSILEGSVDPGHALNDMIDRARAAIPAMQDPQQKAQASQALRKMEQQQQDPRWLLNAYHNQSKKVLQGIMTLKEAGRDTSMLAESYQRIIDKANKWGDRVYVDPMQKKLFDLEMKTAEARLANALREKSNGQWVDTFNDDGDPVRKWVENPKSGDEYLAVPKEGNVTAADDKRNEELAKGQFFTEAANMGLPVAPDGMGGVEVGELTDPQRVALEGLAQQYNFKVGFQSRKDTKGWMPGFKEEVNVHKPFSFAWKGTPQPTSRRKGGRGDSEAFFGYKVRNKLYDGEDRYFKQNPNVTGMASEDGMIIFNPYSKNVNRDAVGKNEAVRLWLRENKITPSFEVTKQQKEKFKDTPYSNDEMSLKHTIVARIISGDSSAGNTTEEQRRYAEQIANRVGGKPPLSPDSEEYRQVVSEFGEYAKNLDPKRAKRIIEGARGEYGDELATELSKMVGGGAKPEFKMPEQQKAEAQKETPKPKYKRLILKEDGSVWGEDKNGQARRVVVGQEETTKYGNKTYANRKYQEYIDKLKELGLYEEYLNKFGR